MLEVTIGNAKPNSDMPYLILITLWTTYVIQDTFLILMLLNQYIEKCVLYNLCKCDIRPLSNLWNVKCCKIVNSAELKKRKFRHKKLETKLNAQTPNFMLLKAYF